MSGFSRDFAWQHKYLAEVKSIVGPQLLMAAPLEVDANEATDLMVLRARDMRIGCRIRRAGFAEKYAWDFTIRSQRDSGAKTELEKIVEGWCDWLFYGHAAHDDRPGLARWFLVDLAALRAHLIRHRDVVRPRRLSNGDGTHFVAFDVRCFPALPPILVASG
jgi:hypothetical protein